MKQVSGFRWVMVVGMMGMVAGVVQAEETTGEASATTQVASLPSSDQGNAASAEMRISMDFQDASLQDVLKALSQQAGINVLASQDVKDRKVTLYLEDVPVLDALDQIL